LIKVLYFSCPTEMIHKPCVQKRKRRKKKNDFPGKLHLSESAPLLHYAKHWDVNRLAIEKIGEQLK